MRLGVTQRGERVCSQLLNPDAAEAAAIAQPTHTHPSIPARRRPPGGYRRAPCEDSSRRRSSAPRPAATARAARCSVSSSPRALA